jgi:hypothetical protein
MANLLEPQHVSTRVCRVQEAYFQDKGADTFPYYVVHADVFSSYSIHLSVQFGFLSLALINVTANAVFRNEVLSY